MIDEPIRTFEATVRFMERSVDDLSEEEMVRQPAGVPNHATWTIGHIIYSCQGIATEVAKQVTGFIRESKFKVTTQIQDQQVRVTGKSRDDLQAVIAAVRAKDFPVALQFTNYRD